ATSTPVFSNPGGLGTLLGGAATIGSAPFAWTAPAVDIAGRAIGNPQAADVAAFALGNKVGRIGWNKFAPTPQAQATILNIVCRKTIPGVIKRLENNPRLSLMDVSEPVRTLAGGLATDPQLGAQDIMANAYRARSSARKDIVRDAVSETLGDA